jgi:hypothetical protein
LVVSWNWPWATSLNSFKTYYPVFLIAKWENKNESKRHMRIKTLLCFEIWSLKGTNY